MAQLLLQLLNLPGHLFKPIIFFPIFPLQLLYNLDNLPLQLAQSGLQLARTRSLHFLTHLCHLLLEPALHLVQLVIDALVVLGDLQQGVLDSGDAVSRLLLDLLNPVLQAAALAPARQPRTAQLALDGLLDRLPLPLAAHLQAFVHVGVNLAAEHPELLLLQLLLQTGVVAHGALPLAGRVPVLVGAAHRFPAAGGLLEVRGGAVLGAGEPGVVAVARVLGLELVDLEGDALQLVAGLGDGPVHYLR